MNRCGVVLTSAVVCLAASSAHAVFDAIGSYAAFTPDVIYTFDDLPLGPLTDGTLLAPGLRFGGTTPDFLPLGAEVVDDGNGGRAIQWLVTGAAAPVGTTCILLQFDTAVDAFAAEWTFVSGQSDDGNPAESVYNSLGQYVTAGSAWGDAPDDFVSGRINLPPDIHFIDFTYSVSNGDIVYRIDNLAVKFVPGPAAFALLAPLAVMRRRRA